MKLISCHIENFGQLQNKDYAFNDNLTCIYENNGAGKTTLAAFIKAMFYGLESTKKTDKNFGDRLHYYPFSNGKFGGYLILNAFDKEYRIESAKMLATLLHGMKGTPYIYQGEELGMTNVRFDDINDYNDIESLNMYKDRLSKGYSHNEIMESIYAKGRDNARTPMQWDDSENAGFTTGTPWLAVNKNYDKINAKQCLQDENSIFNHYKKLIDIRKNNDTIIYGDYKLLCEDDENIFAYVRELNGDKILVVCNFYDKDVEFKFDGDFNYSKVLLSNYNDSSKMIEKLKLRPYEAVMYRFN